MEKSSFFNSVSHDRTYKAEDWAEYFASFIGNGVFPVPSTGLQVVANDGMKLNVKTGNLLRSALPLPRPHCRGTRTFTSLRWRTSTWARA